MTEEANETSTPSKTGYRIPPDGGKFKEGQSGNPGGRPKKKKDDFDAKIIATCESKIPHSANTVIEVILNAAIKAAAKGDIKALRIVFDLYCKALSKRGQTTASDEDDVEAAKRILTLDPRLFSGLTE